MARDSTGEKGQPQYAGSGVPQDAADLTEVAAYAALVGNRKVGTTADRNQALADGDVWDGLEWYDTTDGGLYLLQSGSWLPLLTRWTNFSPQYNGMSGGTTIYSKVRRVLDNAEVRFSWQLGNFPSIGNISLVPPIPIASWLDDTDYIGTVELINVGSSADDRFIGPVINSNGNALARIPTTTGTAAGSAINTSATSSSSPFQWTSGDRIRFTLSYPINI
ncbi:hypothetical protein Csp2054_14335 [Curtobacterium sp. 'Ferrero']|uniref:hypothetical protein n=1 Tax=Curtobacterium sp. 'Ferrero' TaxID=2033654 RepID=UPI000BD44520|nr:hypothetical protein [Curtobacterium sp. 'Ferrero']PCN47017.1 hypothetical protein Csp2054_14335 [Curtobacterium sp. 'Ferrero']